MEIPVTYLDQKSPYSCHLMPIVTLSSALRNFLINSRNPFANCLATCVINSLRLASRMSNQGSVAFQ
ncbi:unnamed protein product [Alternaria burnsii]|nr:unnamed protein product [Alternaria burnsii]